MNIVVVVVVVVVVVIIIIIIIIIMLIILFNILSNLKLFDYQVSWMESLIKAKRDHGQYNFLLVKH
jgi:uncharacterized membrane protein